MDKTRHRGFNYHAIPAGYYDQIFHKARGIQSAWHHLKFRHVCALMGEYENHLDIGCGPGTLIGLLDRGRKSVGVDIAVDQIKYAQRKYQSAQHDFLVLDSSSILPFPDGSFDVITLVELIEHLSREETVILMREVQRLLIPDGRAILTTPNYASCWPLLECLVNRLAPISYEDQHISHYTKGRLKKILRDCGFVDQRVNAFQFLAPFVAALDWKLAQGISSVESKLWGRWFGSLLIAEARKSW